METKIQKMVVDSGFGFPLVLVNVPMVKVRGTWTPKINYNELSLVILRALAHKGSRLTGSEVKFIRSYFEMTLQVFAKRFCVTHVAVLKWEKTKNKPTSMNWTTEKDIRLFIISKLSEKPQELAKLYGELEKLPTQKLINLHVDVKKLAA